MDALSQSAPSHDPAVPADLRRSRIARMIEERDYVRVADLATHFHTSEVTIRSDLDVLATEGRLRRVRGGAMAANPAPERRFEEVRAEQAAEKGRIGAAAARRVADGETVLLDVGTTTTEVARALLARQELQDVVVVTNSLTIAWELEAAIPRFTVVMTGGTLRPLQHSLVEPLGGAILEQLHGHTLFLGCTGVDPDRGVTNVNLPEAAMKRRMVEAAGRTIVVADGSKIGRVTLARVCGIESVDALITDQAADPVVLAALRERGVEVEIV
ncbi:MAG TPA: DeoR/GlpR family DNA-binding transcription regulator [Candidatus Limnocylindrales bacterium]|nr:DeoR/GlpR family DNA-binding transcription regulator [Candidatus Limnocylindrales bacterium]